MLPLTGDTSGAAATADCSRDLTWIGAELETWTITATGQAALERYRAGERNAGHAAGALAAALRGFFELGWSGPSVRLVLAAAEAAADDALAAFGVP